METLAKFYLIVNALLFGHKISKNNFVRAVNALGFLSLLFSVHPVFDLLCESFFFSYFVR